PPQLIHRSAFMVRSAPCAVDLEFQLRAGIPARSFFTSCNPWFLISLSGITAKPRRTQSSRGEESPKF
ncbi:MAG TPA: hypothetical protein VF258_03730, partial [Luteolibacter sp.]